MHAEDRAVLGERPEEHVVLVLAAGDGAYRLTVEPMSRGDFPTQLGFQLAGRLTTYRDPARRKLHGHLLIF
jgi:hypothetical protein